MITNDKLDIEKILKDLQEYRPRRRGWIWRTPLKQELNTFAYHDTSKNLSVSQPLPAAHYFNNIDPQPQATITTEIASGRFEDDIRRMRMAAWHGADHMMVIRTAGQSHFDGLIEGTPQGVGGIPITRKQLRAQRKALDWIEDEVGRPINLHSYISGVSGPEMAVLFVEEGINGAHQDPQYNILYRNINMARSFVDAGSAKAMMAYGQLLQIDGAHNANATAKEAWKITPELLVQHAINSYFSLQCSIPKESICLSSVAPTTPPAPSIRLDLPYAIALRELFDGYKIRAQMNTKYMESSTREATVTHTLNVLLSALTSVDIQSTITPDEGRNVPWHIYNIEAVDTAKQAFNGLDGIKEYVKIDRDQPKLAVAVKECKARSLCMLEEMIESGGYFAAVEQGFFVDSGYYPTRHGDGIVRHQQGGVAANTIVKRHHKYMAPVSAVYGYNNIEQYQKNLQHPADLIGGCSFEKPELISYIDELDLHDNVHQRLSENVKHRKQSIVTPEMQWLSDGVVLLTMFLPVSAPIAQAAALKIAEKMNLQQPEVIATEIMHLHEGTRIELKGKVDMEIDISQLDIKEKPPLLTEDQITQALKDRPMRIVAGTVGNDEHSVGLKEILDIKHGGIEKFGFNCIYLGTSVPIEKLVDAAVEVNADAILMSTIITHDEIHTKMMRKLHEVCIEKGVRNRFLCIVGGTQVQHDIALENGLDAGFGRQTKGIEVASFLIENAIRKQS